MAINVVFKKVIMWLASEKMQVMMDFKNWGGMPSVMGVIHNIHIVI
jgi:hypothetical protein